MYVSNRMSQRLIEGLETFVETAAEYKKLDNMSDAHYICCHVLIAVMRKRLEIYRRFMSTCLLEAL
jgi:hypothetical protein